MNGKLWQDRSYKDIDSWMLNLGLGGPENMNPTQRLDGTREDKSLDRVATQTQWTLMRQKSMSTLLRQGSQ